jgi:hypothetical protein
MTVAAPRRRRRTRWVDHRRWRAPRDAEILMIECRVLREPVVLELSCSRPGGSQRGRPTGFWRGNVFYHILKVLGRRFETGAAHLRVLADRGCFELVRTAEVDARTWRPAPQWMLVAELTAIPIVPFES